MMGSEKIDGIELYKVESDLRSLRESEAIKEDSKRLGAVTTLAHKEMKALSSIAEKKQKLGVDEYGVS